MAEVASDMYLQQRTSAGLCESRATQPLECTEDWNFKQSRGCVPRQRVIRIQTVSAEELQRSHPFDYTHPMLVLKPEPQKPKCAETKQSPHCRLQYSTMRTYGQAWEHYDAAFAMARYPLRKKRRESSDNLSTISGTVPLLARIYAT